MRKITSNEIRVLKMLLCDQNDIIRHQQRRIDELEHQLEESRAKEGKGALENMIDSIADAVAGIGKMFSTMSQDELKELLIDTDEEDDDNAI